ncbi:protein kinase domain-containing protein [Nonomuraea sp. bgisy101]|uniref:serine/threonine-protein kinase n=1 Tax=Nonomuraea sp. bgisy101 TaxID=3413784 RepID=UPI003D71B4D2
MGEPSEQRLVGGRYLLSDELGRGGMGAVWRAHDQVLDRPVALKQVLVPGWMGEKDRERAFERVLREARAAARLRNPYVITIHDVVMDEGHPWIVMELLPASSLAQVLERTGPLPEQVAADIGVKVLEALRTAHAAGITHRDVKPANVLLLDDGGVVLTDFGIAHVADSPTLTATGMLMGSPAYMAPERLEGAPASEASDLWALGATLYTAVEGVPPYPMDSPVAVLAAILMREPRPMRLAVRLEGVVQGLLRKDPQERLSHESAAAVLSRVATRSQEETRRRAGSRALAALVRDHRADASSGPDPDAPTAPAPAAAPGEPATPGEPDAPAGPAVPAGSDRSAWPAAPPDPGLSAASGQDVGTPEGPGAFRGPGLGVGTPEGPGASRGPGQGVGTSEGAGASRGSGQGVGTPEGPGASRGPGQGVGTPEGPGASAGSGRGVGPAVPVGSSSGLLASAPPGAFETRSSGGAGEAAGAPAEPGPRGAVGSGPPDRPVPAGGRVARLLRLLAVAAAGAGVVAYVLPRAATRVGVALPSIGTGTDLLILFAAFALLAVVVPRPLLPEGGTAATVTRALPFVAFAGYLGGYQTGSGSQMTTAMAYGLLCAWTAVTAVRTWRRSRTAAAVAGAATAGFAALAVVHLWLDLAGASGLTALILPVLSAATAAAWTLATVWGWWAARRTG